MAFSFIDNLLRTPGFNPNAQDEYSRKKRPVAPSPTVPLPTANIPRTTPSLPFARVSNAPAALPEASPMPAIAEYPQSSNVIDMAGRARPGGMPGESRDQMPIPALPWATKGAQPYSEARAREYDYYRGDPMGQAEAARIEGGINNANVGKGIGGFLNRLKSGLKPGLIGLTQGGIGGGIAGLIGGAVDPTSGRKYEFENIDKPKLIERQAREDQERARQGRIARARLEEQDSIIDRTMKEAQTRNIGSQIEERGSKMRLDELDTQSQIRLRDAQAEAARTGKPKTEKITMGDGKVHLIQVFADGNRVDLGISGDATIKGEDRASREKIEGLKETGRNTRASQSEAGKNVRNAAGGGSGGKDFVSITAIRAAVKKYNEANPGSKISESDMIALRKKQNPRTQIVK